MTLPVIIASTKEALAAVPIAFREACWNLGATRWQTIRTIVLPNSISGILTGVILQVSRAAGETAPILFTGAVFFVSVADTGRIVLPLRPARSVHGALDHLFTLTTQVTGVSEALQYGTAVVLLGLVLVVNAASIALRAWLRVATEVVDVSTTARTSCFSNVTRPLRRQTALDGICLRHRRERDLRHHRPGSPARPRSSGASTARSTSYADVTHRGRTSSSTARTSSR